MVFMCGTNTNVCALLLRLRLASICAEKLPHESSAIHAESLQWLRSPFYARPNIQSLPVRSTELLASVQELKQTPSILHWRHAATLRTWCTAAGGWGWMGVAEGL